jgi:hypothetical protein
VFRKETHGPKVSVIWIWIIGCCFGFRIFNFSENGRDVIMKVVRKGDMFGGKVKIGDMEQKEEGSKDPLRRHHGA